MFGVVVTHIFKSRIPIDMELLARNLVGNPKIAHFHRVGVMALNGVVGNSTSGGVVALDGSRRLWVAKFF